MLMLALGLYWCTEAYLNWVDQPVLTTISNAGLPVDNVSTVGPHYMRGIGTPKIDLHIMNSHIKRPRMTDY